MGFKTLHEGKVTFNAKAAADLLDGYIVKALSTYDPSASTPYEEQLLVDKCDAAADQGIVVGITVGSFTSGNLATIARDGVYLTYAGGAIKVGEEVGVSEDDPMAVVDATFVCAGSENALNYVKPVGTALSTAASGEQVVVALNV